MSNAVNPEKLILWIPRKFYQDHEERLLPSGEALKRTERRVLVQCTHEELAELLSDAEYYSDRYGPDDLPQGLKASAQRTIFAIKKHLREGK